MTADRVVGGVDVLKVLDFVGKHMEAAMPTPLGLSGESSMHPCRHADVTFDLRQSRAAVAELLAADEEYDEADAAWGGEWYEVDSYGIDGSDFLRCIQCGNESGAGLLNKGVDHDSDCEVGRLEVATARRAAALANARGAK